MSELRKLHPYLFRRVQLKGITFTLLGLALIIPTHISSVNTYINSNQADSTRLYESVPYDVWGAIFVVIGLGILWTLRYQGSDYKASRPWLKAAFYYALFWLFALVLAVVTGNARSASIVILWGYMTYNIWLIGHDSGWEGASILKEYQERSDGL
jgi:hypothetical protein